jgi:DNA-binding HxlR family transcriptional regulator
MFGIIKLTIHTITGMWVSIVLFKLMTNGWSGFYFQYTNEMMPDCFLAQKLPDLVGPKFIHKVVLHNS